MSKPFQNTSIFQDIIEFSDENGAKYRFFSCGLGIWREHVLRGDAYICAGHVSISGRATARKLWAASRQSEVA